MQDDPLAWNYDELFGLHSGIPSKPSQLFRQDLLANTATKGPSHFFILNYR
jgi:hypothetical protein